MKATLLEDFALGCTEQIFCSLCAATWSNPEVVLALLRMANQQDSVVVLNDNAGRNSMLHIECFNNKDKALPAR